MFTCVCFTCNVLHGIFFGKRLGTKFFGSLVGNTKGEMDNLQKERPTLKETMTCFWATPSCKSIRLEVPRNNGPLVLPLKVSGSCDLILWIFGIFAFFGPKISNFTFTQLLVPFTGHNFRKT